MEYLPGGTIADRMRAARVPPALALAWLAQAGRALDAAHAQGVVHRDVKPANLMLGADGELRVTDFGIARIAGDVSLTSVGTILGTSGYMSPEQAVGGTATPASDRYGARRRRVRAARRPQAVRRGDVRERGRGARDGADPGGDELRPLAAGGRSTPSSSAGWRRPRRTASARAASSWRACRAAFAESAGTTVRIVLRRGADAATAVAAPRRGTRSQSLRPRTGRASLRTRCARASSASSLAAVVGRRRRRGRGRGDHRRCGRRPWPGSRRSGPSPSRRSPRRRRAAVHERRRRRPAAGPRERRRAQRPGLPAAPGAATPPPRSRCSSRRSRSSRAPARSTEAYASYNLAWRALLDRELRRRQGAARAARSRSRGSGRRSTSSGTRSTRAASSD